jgi:hypothetical protein
MSRFWFVVICCFFGSMVSAQQLTQEHEEVHLNTKAKHNIKLATTLALIPGAGQAYNRKYWKIPIVWGAVGGTVYYYTALNGDFNEYKSVLEFIIDRPDLETRTDLELAAPELFEAVPSPFYQNTRNGVANEAIGYMDQLRTQREYAFFAIFAVYGLSILDANIDAHLFDFDVSDDLSLRPTVTCPAWTPNVPVATPGLKLTLTLP